MDHTDQPDLTDQPNHGEYIDAIESELATIVDVVAAGPSTAAVPSCPEFDLFGLARHVGQVCGFWIHLLADADGRPTPELPPCDEPSEQAGWLADLGRQLVEELRRTTAASPCWTWDPGNQTAGFVARRVCHELTIHRVDAQLAVGPADPVSADVAADGIDELFLLAAVSPRGAAPLSDPGAEPPTVHLHGTDAEGEWFIRVRPDELEVTHEHAKGDLAVRAALGDLELLLYGRPPDGPVEMFGDESVLAVLQSRLSR